jgi:arylsulfatase A-like enzyme
MKLSPLLFGGALCFAATLASAADASAPRRMNVLLLISDDLRTDLGIFGHPIAQTPNLDQLAGRSVMFERAYCQYPLCNPSRTSMLTGRYPATSQLYGNRDWFGGWYPDWVSLPKYFKNHGFTTLRTGKIFHGIIDDAEAWTEGGVRHRFYDQKRPDSFVADRPVTPEEETARVGRMIDSDRARPESDRWEAVEGEAVATMGDTRVADQAIAYLERYRNQAATDAPFFIAAGFSKPHSPLVAPKRFFDLYRKEDITLPPDFAEVPMVPDGFPRASIRPNNADLFVARRASPDAARDMIHAYLACVSYVDWNVGRVLEALDELGLRESTIVLFWGDHGYQLGEKGKWSKAGSLWEQGTRVPLLIFDPRADGNGQHSPRVVESIDIYPTLADLAGLPAPAGLDGRSLRPLLEKPEREWDHVAYSVWNERGRGITGVVVRNERWRYAEFFGPGAGAFLTEPATDPHEVTNLVRDPRYAEVVAELSALARAHVAGKTEPTPDPSW